MKKIKVLTVIITLILLFTGCTSASLDTANKIVPPRGRTAPLEGKWLIDKCLTTGIAKASTSENKWVGKAFVFSGVTAALGENVWGNVSYKAKWVNSDEYFLHKYSGEISKLGISAHDLLIITLSAEDKFLYEFIKLNDNELLVNLDEDYFHLYRTQDNSGIKADISNNNFDQKQADQDSSLKIPKTGLFLGIRRLAQAGNGQDSVKNYKYLTYWVAALNGDLHPVLYSEGIFMPRKSGFWKVEVSRISEDGRLEEFLNAYSVNSGNGTILPQQLGKEDFWSGREGTLNKVINFLGNDYASIEYSGKGKLEDGSKWSENKLRTLPIDNLASEQGVKLSDIAGENGTLAVETAVNDLLNASNIKSLKKPDTGEIEKNISLYRKTGHWFIKGRLEGSGTEGIPYSDFNINLIPPQTLVAYDELLTPWTYIKDRIPDAVDAYTSPNRDIAIIVTKTQFMVYELAGSELSEVPLAKIALQEGDSVIMAEWGLGIYMDKWEKAFIKYTGAKTAPENKTK